MIKKILITGITGQVGSQLADYVLENTNYEIIGMMRWQEPLDNIYHLTKKINQNKRIKIYYADLLDFSSIFDLLMEHKPDYISHLAAQSFPRTSFDIPIETLQTNIIGTANLLENIKKLINQNIFNPIVHICSSSEVYGKAKNIGKINEETSFHGASPYSISKIGVDYLGQFYGEAYKIKTFITRMGTHSGPRRSDVFFESTVAKQIALIENDLQDPFIKIGNLDSIRTYQDVRDAVKAYMLLFDAFENKKIKEGDYFNIAGDESYSLSEIIEILLSFSNKKDIKIISDKNRFRPIDANYQMFDNRKLNSVIDWSPQISVSDMLKDLLNHWRVEISKDRIPLNR